MGEMRGLYREKSKINGRRVGPETGPWKVKRIIPAPLRDRFHGQTALVVTTKTTDVRAAKAERDRLWTAWDEQISAARALGPGPIATEGGVLAAIENWRLARCDAADGLARRVMDDHRYRMQPALSGFRSGAAVGATFPPPPLPPEAPGDWNSVISAEPLALARAYFEDPANVGKSRDPAMPIDVHMQLDRLQMAVKDPLGWTQVTGFDAAMDAAVEAGGLVGSLTATVRDRTRQPFARAWLEVARREEAERRRAAIFLAAIEAASARPEAVVVEGAPAYQAKPGDRTLAEVIASFRKTLTKAKERKYKHIYAALEEIIGPTRVMRSISPEDIIDLRTFLYRVPKYVTRRFKKKTLSEAVEAADKMEDISPDCEIPRLSSNTVRTYMNDLSVFFNHAKDVMRAVDYNPVSKLVPPKRKGVQRRGFSSDELVKVFGAMTEDRKTDSAYFWVPSILAFSGARANEIAQLRTDDVKVYEGVNYIDLTPFDKDGVRTDKSFKNEHSHRAIPIHPELVRTGFLDFVNRRRAAGEEQLFPELRPNAVESYSHEVTRRFARLCDRVGLSERALCLHSLRHGFRDACWAVGLDDNIIDALGGWAPKGEAARYGDRNSVKVLVPNAAHLAKITLGGFKLAAA